MKKSKLKRKIKALEQSVFNWKKSHIDIKHYLSRELSEAKQETETLKSQLEQYQGLDFLYGQACESNGKLLAERNALSQENEILRQQIEALRHDIKTNKDWEEELKRLYSKELSEMERWGMGWKLESVKYKVESEALKQAEADLNQALENLQAENNQLRVAVELALFIIEKGFIKPKIGTLYGDKCNLNGCIGTIISANTNGNQRRVLCDKCGYHDIKPKIGVNVGEVCGRGGCQGEIVKSGFGVYTYCSDCDYTIEKKQVI